MGARGCGQGRECWRGDLCGVGRGGGGLGRPAARGDGVLHASDRRGMLNPSDAKRLPNEHECGECVFVCVCFGVGGGYEVSFFCYTFVFISTPGGKPAVLPFALPPSSAQTLLALAQLPCTAQYLTAWPTHCVGCHCPLPRLVPPDGGVEQLLKLLHVTRPACSARLCHGCPPCRPVLPLCGEG